MSHRHEWATEERLDNLSRYSCFCGAEMLVEDDQDGTRTTLFEPYARPESAEEEDPGGRPGL